MHCATPRFFLQTQKKVMDSMKDRCSDMFDHLRSGPLCSGEFTPLHCLDWCLLPAETSRPGHMYFFGCHAEVTTDEGMGPTLRRRGAVAGRGWLGCLF